MLCVSATIHTSWHSLEKPLCASSFEKVKLRLARSASWFRSAADCCEHRQPGAREPWVESDGNDTLMIGTREHSIAATNKAIQNGNNVFVVAIFVL